MILQSTLTPSSPHPLPLSSPISFPHGSSSFASFPILRTHKLNTISIKCSISQIHNYGTMDYEKRPLLKWNNIFKRISTMAEDPQMNVASVLNQCENEGKKISKWELCRIAKELRKFKRYKLALQVYEWMNNRIERYRLSSSDTAIQLDLIAKVHGVTYAEDYYTRVPDTLKDKRIYGALLNAYAGAKLRDKAENLMEEMRNRGHAVQPLPYNVMMTLYMKLNELDKVDGLISEMKQKSIPLDLYTYNIWLSARGSQGSAEAMEQVFQEMSLDPTIVPNWTTFSTMAAMYVKMGQLEKAEQCLKNLETRITGRDKMPYHYLISLYGSLGNRDEVYRVWNVYKSVMSNIPNWGYHSVISSLVRLGDIEGAEKLYEEWLPVKTSYDPKVGNLLIGWYVKKEPFEKVKGFFDHMIEAGGKPNATSWEILGEAHLKERRISEALACFKEAVSEEGAMKWRLKPSNVNAFLELCDQEDNQACKEEIVGLLTHTGCLQDEYYRSLLTGLGEKAVEITDEQVMFNDPEMLHSVTE
ncbi:pentatricopeptide repeat-containing protein At1g02150-like [Silene latifolia]|uniref:pentatricopeptide repeat-containing protein At1g02150-like n=1 Tax=Silene latifolia TaxID=37657 RepID=UPI003D76A603